MFPFLLLTGALILSCFGVSILFSTFLYRNALKNISQLSSDLPLLQEQQQSPCVGLLMASVVAIVYGATNDRKRTASAACYLNTGIGRLVLRLI